MPITAQQKLEILQQVGVDPDKYWLDDDGNVVDLPKDNSAMAGVKTALLNLPRTAAGIGGAALGTAGAGALGLPSGPGAVATGIAGGFAGAAAGSTIGEKLQQALYPDDVLLAQEARQVRNPVATQLGDLASLAAFMRPSLTQTRDAIRGVRALTTLPKFSKLRPSQSGALMNMAMGGTIGGASTLAQGGDAGEIAKDAAIGAVFSNPTWLAGKMTRGVFSPHVPDMGLRDAVNPADLLVKPGEPAAEKPREVNPELLKAFARQQKVDAKLAEQLAALKANQEAAAKRAQIEAEQGIGNEQPLPAQDFTLPQDLNSLESRFLRSTAVEPDVEVTLDPQQPKPQPKPPVIAEPPPPGALDQELGTRMTKPFFNWWQNNAGENYRTRMNLGRPTGEQGQAVAGVTEGTRGADGKRNITVNEQAYTDTAPHELTHGMILDVLQHGKKGEQAEMRRLLKAAGVDEEAFVQGVGEDVVRRFMGKTDDSWRSDFVSFMKYKFGKATPADARRIMSNTMLRGGGPKGVSRIVAKPTQQVEEEERVIPPTEGKPPVMPETRPDRMLPYVEEGKVTSEARPVADTTEVTLNDVDTTLPFNERRALPPAAEQPATPPESRTLAGTPERQQLTFEPLGDVRGTLEQGAEPTNIEGVRESGELTPEERYAAEDAKIRRLEEEAAALRRRRDFPRAVKQAEGNPAPERGERLPGSERRGREREVKRALRSADLENADLSNVGREEVRESTKAEFTNKMKQGRTVSENARESAADLEARRIEAELAGEERPRYQEFGEDRPLKFRQTEGPFKDEVLVTKSAKEPGRWQATHIADQGDGTFEPNGHATFNTRDEAIRSAQGENINGPAAGSRTFKLVEDSRYQQFGPNRTFATDFEKELGKAAPFKIQSAKDGRMSRNDINAAVSKLNPTEQEMLKEAGLEQYLTKVARPTKEELQAWADENLPRVEVKELSAQGANKAIDAELGGLQHNWYDNLSMRQRSVADAMIAGDDVRNSEIDANFGADEQATLRRYVELSLRAEGTISDVAGFDNDSATAANDIYNINPRQLKDMPGAVDLLVRLPARKIAEYGSREELENTPYRPERAGKSSKMYDENGKMVEREQPLYSSNHYPQSGDNLLAHVRAYEHTMPDGERVLRVFELQSDWAQNRRKQETYTKTLDNKLTAKFVNDIDRPGHKAWLVTMVDDNGYKNQRYSTKATEAEAIEEAKELFYHGKPTAPHLLLPHHQRLALKAAIEHARKRGIKRVVIDDAETAMMTEGHDKIIDRARKDVANANSGQLTEIRNGEYGYNVDLKIAIRQLEKRYKNNGAKFEIQNGKIVMTRGPFEGGMGLSYDNVLQQMMRDLSGDGVKVEMGEHRNATFTRDGNESDIKVPRKDLIFRNPDGTPKTQSTGVAYDTSAAQARRDAGEPFSYAGRRYQQFGPNRPTSGLPDAEGRLSASPFESASQKAARSDNPVIRTVGRALTELFPAQRAMRGKYRALPEAFADLKESDKDLLYKILIDEYRAGKPAPGTVPARLRKEYNDVRRTLRQMRDDQIAAGQRNSNGAVPGIDDSYFPNVVDPSVRKTIVDEIDSPRFKQLKDEFVKFNEANLRSKNYSAAKANEEANKLFNRFIGTLNKQPVAGAFDFGAVVLPEGSRLPDNWLHSDPAEAMSQYVRDWSRSRAFHDIVQTNEDVMAGLGQEEFFVNGKKTPVKNRVATPAVKDNNILFLLNEAVGIRRGSQDKITGAIGRAASAAWLANPITRSVDVATPVFKAMGILPPSQIPGMIANFRNIARSMQNAQDTGWINKNGNTIVGEVLGAGEHFTNNVDKFSKGLSKYTGSEWLENFGRGLSQNIGEYTARVHGPLAMSGNKRSADFLNRVAPNWRTLSEAELGTRIGQLFQGRYDATNLPQWLSDSPAAPFFSLARWNIEQWNNFREFAIKPARNGDPVPLISMLVAGIAGGVGIKEIREALSGRKSKIATLKEIAEAPEGSAKYKEAVRYLGNLAQLSGTMGIVSEMSNWGLDIASKDMPAAASMPALEVTRDIIPRLIAAGNAMMDGEDPLTVITQVSRDIGNEHVSAYRFLEGNLGRTGVWSKAGEDLADANARRDLRVGKRLRGEPIKAAVQLPIDYSRAEERRVEKERDPVKMREMARELKADIKSDPDKDNRERRMRSAAASRPSYMPSKENDPKAFREQLDFVRRTQGPAKAEDLRLRYLRDKRNADKRRQMFK